jgi:folate-binding protein YgfZ
MEIIDQLEPVKRGPYAGVVGYLDFSGNLDTAIAIRTMVVQPDGRASVQAGAGIVVDSVPEHEDLECRNKAQALLAAVPAARRMTAARRAMSRTAFAAWIDRDVIRAHGPDTLTFLQGQLSQDLEAMALDESRSALLLEPSGKITAWLRVTRTADDEFILDTDRGTGDAVIARLNRFKLRTKCVIEPVEGWRCLAVRNTTVEDSAARPIAWPGVEGVDLLGADVTPPVDVPMRDDEYERLRIESGVPAMGRELTESMIPVDAGQWLIDASVSFTKGCYTGQELVARIDSRGGNAPHPVRGLRIPGRLEVGAPVTSVDGRPLGELTSVYFIADRDETIALAPLARVVQPPADVLVAETTGRLIELPMR